MRVDVASLVHGDTEKVDMILDGGSTAYADAFARYEVPNEPMLQT